MPYYSKFDEILCFVIILKEKFSQELEFTVFPRTPLKTFIDSSNLTLTYRFIILQDFLFILSLKFLLSLPKIEGLQGTLTFLFAVFFVTFLA